MHKHIPHQHHCKSASIPDSLWKTPSQPPELHSHRRRNTATVSVTFPSPPVQHSHQRFTHKNIPHQHILDIHLCLQCMAIYITVHPTTTGAMQPPPELYSHHRSYVATTRAVQPPQQSQYYHSCRCPGTFNTPPIYIIAMTTSRNTQPPLGPHNMASDFTITIPITTLATLTHLPPY